MATTLRLFKIGKKGYHTFKIVAVDRRYKADGDYIEALGAYNPNVDPVAFELKKERFEYWTNKGAIISEGLGKLLKNKDIKKKL
ncbi:MAG: 30S ribosomal protein S16 [Candidatus Roizmanbacteria bacterium GW2011_GWA2_35_19]|uniref:Small ribosomal subunit protein bS16 n=2 Tax=Candidatus Roizmaniibacteriota TaxID=1752723 RepID=A0A0G0C883_9BACT|nr:MAG: 30S ribosomal protein S16 [Candidatus Roizmanbacteria bacterium GW2011_GWC2_35_12]KKP72331.1 MAG: 30S ribosomal protein S16 [Candidatus Roizmanbacteria bacterium GW2011_GWA2_35_19]